jgi:hydroxymethylpyrimidine/phosphomethylpyrimidine kinase
MSCRRCNGMMVREWCMELYAAYVMKCINCGAVVDPIIISNQGLAQKLAPVVVELRQQLAG